MPRKPRVVTERRYGWKRGMGDDIDITDAQTPHCVYAAPFIQTVKQAKAVCAALNALEVPRG